MTFLFAGHETTSNATSWALHLLAQHPHEQDLLREELVKAFPNKSKVNPTFDEINSLEYLNCIIKETLRLISPGINLIYLFIYLFIFVKKKYLYTGNHIIDLLILF